MKLLFSFLFFTSIAFSQTVVNGGIYQNTTWTLANSPYLMTGSVVVFPGKTLTIEPGVQVLVTPDFSGSTGNFRYLEVRGSLVAVGTDQAPITFEPTDPTNPGFPTWTGITIKGSQGGSFQLDRFRLNNALYGLYNDIVEPGVTYNFTNCQFKNNQYSIQLNADMVYQNCLFENNGVGQAAQIQYGTLTANNCQFINNFCSFTWSNNIQVTNCLFEGNGNNIVGSPGTISDCQFIDNDFGLAEAYGHTLINCYFSGNGVGIDNTGAGTISNCTFENNDVALRIGDAGNVSNNLISNNVIGIAVVGANPSSIVIVDNVICSNTSYNLQNLTDKNFEVNENCFCMADSAIIESYIYDGYDDITKGLVNYAIYDDSCENILEYIVKVNLGTGSLTELNESSFQVVQQTPEYLMLHLPRTTTIQLTDLTGSVLKEQNISEALQQFQLPNYTSGFYILKDLEGNTKRVFLQK